MDIPKENLISYHGPINIDLVSFISNYLKQYIKADNSVIGRIYKVLIELIQNVSYYSADQYSNLRSFGSGIGWFRIDAQNECFTITTGNKILKEHGPILLKNSEEINALDEEALRDLKRKTRSQANIRDIGAHIGLIQTGLITGNNLEIKVEPIDNEFSFLIISASVNKTNT
ncbi:MAG: SiaB family protein kinase [Bacteroidales bacterium]|nr:SiaB family protein kinase [Bacteroidales bacterium]